MYELNKMLTIIGTVLASVTISRYYTGMINEININNINNTNNTNNTNNINNINNINKKFDIFVDEFRSKLDIIDNKITELQDKTSGLDQTDQQIIDIHKNISFLTNIFETSATKLDNDTLDIGPPKSVNKWFNF